MGKEGILTFTNKSCKITRNKSNKIQSVKQIVNFKIFEGGTNKELKTITMKECQCKVNDLRNISEYSRTTLQGV